MVTKSDVLALLEDGPEEAAQLAEWLEIEPARLLTVLDRMDIPCCANCGRFFVPSAYRATRYCSRDCDQTRTIGRPSFGTARESVETQVGRRPTGASVERWPCLEHPPGRPGVANIHQHLSNGEISFVVTSTS